MSDEDRRKPIFSKDDRMFPGQDDAIKKSIARAQHNANANIGDSLESRMSTTFLGGGSDQFNGLNGYIGEFLGESQYDGNDGKLRSPNYANPLSKYFGKKNETKKAWMRMKMTNDVYENDGQVASIIDLMADFATEGIKFTHGNESVQKFYESWAQKIKLKKRFRSVIIELLNCGNTFLYKIFAKLDAKEERAMKTFTVGQRIGDKFLITTEDDEDVLLDPKIEYDSSIRIVLEAAKGELTDEKVKDAIKDFVVNRLESNAAKIVEKDIKPGAKKVVPWKYIAMNPCQIMPNDEGGWVYLMTKEEVAKLLKTANVQYDELKKSLRVSMPDGVSGRITATKHSGFFAEMALQEERLVVLQYGKKDWQRWGIGLTWKAMPTIVFKNILRQMETKTAKAGINTAILWKIGDHKEGLIPIMEDYERLADMLKAPASTLNVIWNSAIDVDVIQPKIKEIFDTKRWEELRKEVTSQFGITQSVVTGEGGNFSSSFISVQGLLEKLQTIRDMLMEEWLMEEIYIVHQAMGFRKLPKVRFGRMSLRDEAAEKTFIMNMYDRGLISDTTLYEDLDIDAEIERERLLNEYDWEDEHNFDRRGPFIKDPQQHVLDEKRLELDKERMGKEFEQRDKEMEHSKEMDEKKLKEDTKLKQQQMKMKQQTQKGPNGRPPGSKKPQEKKRPKKPKNIARTDVETIVQTLDQNAKDYLVAKAGVKDFRGLSKEDKNKVMDLVGIGLAELDAVGVEEVLHPEFMNENLETANEAFAIGWLEKAKEFMATHKRRPRKAEIYQIFVDTYLEN